MMIGIRFKIPNEYNCFLKQILENMNTQNGVWFIKTDDIIKSDGAYLFAKESYMDKEFKSIIGDNNYYLRPLTKSVFQTGFVNRLFLFTILDIKKSIFRVLIPKNTHFFTVVSHFHKS